MLRRNGKRTVVFMVMIILEIINRTLHLFFLFIRLSFSETFQHWSHSQQFQSQHLKTSSTENTTSCYKSQTVAPSHNWDMTKYFSFPIPGPEEAALGGADWEGPGQTPWLLLCPAGRARHRGPGHADGGSLWLPDAPGQLHQPSGGTYWYRPHLGQDAQLQRSWVREGVEGNFGGITP